MAQCSKKEDYVSNTNYLGPKVSFLAKFAEIKIIIFIEYGSLTIGTGSGGVKMMGGTEEVIGSTTTFEFSKEVPSFPTKTKDAPPKFKAVEKKKPEFKVVKK